MKSLLAWILLLSLSLSASAGTLTDALDGDLVRDTEGKIKKVPKGALADKKVLAFYYSAHWCPPCRAFTPKLSEKYLKLSKEHPEFELIFVSSDRNENAMEEYMQWGKMTFPAVKFGKRVKALDQMSASGIPYLVVTDADGKVLLGKGDKDWVHPEVILPKLEALLKSGPVADASPQGTAAPKKFVY